MIHNFAKSKGVLLTAVVTTLLPLTLLSSCGESARQIESDEPQNVQENDQDDSDQVPRQNGDNDESGQQDQDNDNEDGKGDGD